jgi:serine/threonine protein kinase
VSLLLVHPPRERGGYQIVRPLGEGAFGQVFEAVEVSSARRVALKALRAYLLA